MLRKLVQHGEKTLMVSLPAKWVQAQGLQKGDEVVLTTEKSSVTISKEDRLEAISKIKTSIKLGPTLHIRSIISNAYKLGYDELMIDYSGKEQLELIKQEVKRMIGFEIINLTAGSCTIKSVIRSSAEEYENIKKRSWFSIKSAFDTLISDLKAGKLNNYPIILEMYENNLKFTDFCRRLINKHLFLDIKHSCLEYSVVLKLVSVMSLINEAYFYLVEKKINPGKDFIALVKESSDYFDIVYDAYYKKSLELHSKVVTGFDVFDSRNDKLLKKYGLPASKFLELMRYCRRFGGHIAGLYFLANELKE